MSELINMLEDELFEEESINQEETTSENVSVEETDTNEVEEIMFENIALTTTDLISWLNSNENNLQFCKKIDITGINDLNENILLLKNINCDKEFIQMYKNADTYKVLDFPCHHMKLFGENGFHILYNVNEQYKIKFYGTKTTVYATICLQHDEKLFPIYHYKSNKSKLENYDVANLVTIEHFNNLVNNNTNFNFEDCILLYPPIHKTDNEMTTKLEVLEWLHEKSLNVFDVPHAVKIDIAMWRILFMH